MSRFLSISTLHFMGIKVAMESFIDPWGESDSLLTDMETHGYDEPDSLAFWLFLAETAPPNALAIDVGAYSGMFSIFAAKKNPGLGILSLEASTVTHGRLVRNLLLNSVESRVVAGRYAAWEKEERLNFPHRYGVYSTNAGESLVLDSDVDHMEPVDGITLDSLAAHAAARPGVFSSRSSYTSNCNNIQCIKVDVEGAEDKVLQGCIEIMREQKPAIICEILTENSLRKVEDIIKSVHYVAMEIKGERNFILVPEYRKESILAEHNEWKRSAGDDMLELHLHRDLRIRVG